ncbi:hypothetical protein EOD41_16800 [Mucilaginibacter limnophilus]|uniref:Uncharacterized protein n=1 Tax=Mucilaginibacter limnophilus TaxID=1932778 RepID=A0A437MLE1_9SPHI|nr:hypothetical protein [Mucilaginibacter limnophilus]RVT98449.1 hypothetical protein EOD41_16800 [Mucilaginibacter limnophilus]
MLSQISWTNYLVSIIVLLVIYYGWVGLRFFGSDLRRGWGPKRSASIADLADLTVPSVSVMGAIAPEPEQLRDHTEMLFDDPEPDAQMPPTIADDIVPDIQQFESELQALVDVITVSKESKANFLLLFGLLTEKYAAVTDPEVHDRIKVLLLQQAGAFAFKLTAEELEKQWFNPVIH